MNSLRKLLVVFASAGLVGSAHAVEQAREPGALTPAVQRQTELYAAVSVPLSNPFMNHSGFQAGANDRTASAAAVNAIAVKYVPADTGARSTRAAYPAPRPNSGAPAAGTVLEMEWTFDGTRIDLEALANAGAVIAPKAGRADGGFRLSAPTMPEPTEWMQLLCGLVVAGFIARRRTSVVAG